MASELMDPLDSRWKPKRFSEEEVEILRQMIEKMGQCISDFREIKEDLKIQLQKKHVAHESIVVEEQLNMPLGNIYEHMEVQNQNEPIHFNVGKSDLRTCCDAVRVEASRYGTEEKCSACSSKADRIWEPGGLPIKSDMQETSLHEITKSQSPLEEETELRTLKRQYKKDGSLATRLAKCGMQLHSLPSEKNINHFQFLHYGMRHEAFTQVKTVQTMGEFARIWEQKCSLHIGKIGYGLQLSYMIMLLSHVSVKVVESKKGLSGQNMFSKTVRGFEPNEMSRVVADDTLAFDPGGKWCVKAQLDWSDRVNQGDGKTARIMKIFSSWVTYSQTKTFPQIQLSPLSAWGEVVDTTPELQEMSRRDLLMGQWKPYREREVSWKHCYKGGIKGEEIAAYILHETAIARHSAPDTLSSERRVLTNIASGTSENTKVVIEHGAVLIMVKPLASQSNDVREQAVWALGNVVGDSPQGRDLVFSQGALLPLFSQLDEHAKFSILRNATWTFSNFCRGKPQPPFDRNHKESIKKEDCWTIANIAAGNRDQIQAVCEAVLIGSLLNSLQNAESDIKKEAAWAISNAKFGSSPDQIKHMVEQGVVTPLCDLLTCPDPRIIIVCSEGWENNLKVGEAEKGTGNTGDVNFYAQLIDGAENIGYVIPTLGTGPFIQDYEKHKPISQCFSFEHLSVPVYDLETMLTYIYHMVKGVATFIKILSLAAVFTTKMSHLGNLCEVCGRNGIHSFRFSRDESIMVVLGLEGVDLLHSDVQWLLMCIKMQKHLWLKENWAGNLDFKDKLLLRLILAEFKRVICSGDSKTVEATRLMHNMISFGYLLLLLKGVESDFEIMSTRAVNERKHLGNTCLNSVFRTEDNAIRARCVKVIMKHRENSPARNIAYEWWHSPRPPELFLGIMNSEFKILAEVQIQGGGNTNEKFKMLRILSGATANFPELYFCNLEEKAMELVAEEELEASSRGGSAPPADRGALKIARFKRQKVAESKLLEIKERKERRGRSTKVAGLSTPVESEEEDILDDDREEWLSTINSAICKVIDLVEMQGMLSAIKENQLKNGHGEFNSYLELGQSSTTKEKDQGGSGSANDQIKLLVIIVYELFHSQRPPEMSWNKIEWGNYGTSVDAKGMSLQLMVNGFAVLNWKGTNMIKVQDTELSQSEQGSVESSGCINLEDKVVIHGGSIDRIHLMASGLTSNMIIKLLLKPISV